MKYTMLIDIYGTISDLSQRDNINRPFNTVQTPPHPTPRNQMLLSLQFHHRTSDDVCKTCPCAFAYRSYHRQFNATIKNRKSHGDSSSWLTPFRISEHAPGGENVNGNSCCMWNRGVPAVMVNMPFIGEEGEEWRHTRT